MNRPRVTILRLMGLIVVLALGLSVLARPTRLGAAILSGSLLSSLAVALIGVVLDRGPRRPFWVGFLIAGWSYVIIDYWGELANLFNIWDLPEVITDTLRGLFEPPTATPTAVPPPPIPPTMLGTSGTISSPYYLYPPAMPPPTSGAGMTDRDWSIFPRTVHMLLAWTAATTGGLIGRWMKRAEAERPS